MSTQKSNQPLKEKFVMDSNGMMKSSLIWGNGSIVLEQVMAKTVRTTNHQNLINIEKRDVKLFIYKPK